MKGSGRVFGWLLLTFAVLLFWGFCLPSQYSSTYMGELKEKVRLLRTTPGPRIVLVGGSAAAFGVDSPYLMEELPGYQVVNFGMYAALGTTVMLDLSRDLIREGDIVILLPELSPQTLSDYFDASVFWQGLDGAFSLIFDLPGRKLLKLLGTFPSFAGQKCALFLKGDGTEGMGVYTKASFNASGDVDSPLCDCNRMPGGLDENMPIRFDEGPSEEFCRLVNEYAAYLSEKGAQTWFAFCPMNALAMDGEASIEDFYDGLQDKLSIPLIGDPRDSILSYEWFYDTNFHLNGSGKKVYTRVLLGAIKAMLSDSRETKRMGVSMPLPARIPLWQGEDGDAPFFVYGKKEGTGGDMETLAITGLTKEGKEKEKLTIPSTHQGLPVTTIEEGAFEGAGVKEITLQRNIRIIKDGAFRGCPSLSRIVLEQEEPGRCLVGQGLLTGTGADILVPEASLFAYRTDYGWSIHGGRIQAY